MRVVVTGHRPNKLGFQGYSGYDAENPLRVAIRAQMRSHVEQLQPEEAISGYALGIDQDFVRVCLELSIPVCAAVPFRGQENLWPEESKRIYQELLGKASRVVYVCEGGYAAWKLQKRNEWQVDEVGADGVVLACWDGSPGGTQNCHDYAMRRKRRIIRIDPDAVAVSL